MAYDIFVLVWDERFVREFVNIAVPFQLSAGNLPALSKTNQINYHIYTDRASRKHFADVPAALGEFADVKLHYFEDVSVGAKTVAELMDEVRGPEIKYQTQQHCMIHLLGELQGDPERLIVILDPNFVLTDGCLAAMDQRRRAGASAVMVNALRISRNSGLPDLQVAARGRTLRRPREMVAWALRHLHKMSSTAFIDAAPFTPYPSQIYWRVDTTGMTGRCFLPHPLMVRNDSALKKICSTMDYDFALRGCNDDDIAIISDSDEILICKFSDDIQAKASDVGPPPSPTNLALFAIACTHHRHRVFAETPMKFHTAEIDDRWLSVEAAATHFITDVYTEVESILARSGQLDAKFLMHIKSYTGPIENFTSPQLEPAALVGWSDHAQQETAAA